MHSSRMTSGQSPASVGVSPIVQLQSPIVPDSLDGTSNSELWTTVVEATPCGLSQVTEPQLLDPSIGEVSNMTFLLENRHTPEVNYLKQHAPPTPKVQDKSLPVAMTSKIPMYKKK